MSSLPVAHTATYSAISTVLVPSVDQFCPTILCLRKTELLHTFSISWVTIASFIRMLLLYPRQATTVKMKGTSSKFPFLPTSTVKTQYQQISPMLPVRTFLDAWKQPAPWPRSLCAWASLWGQKQLCTFSCPEIGKGVWGKVGSWLGGSPLQENTTDGKKRFKL